MDWLRSEDLKEEKVVTTPFVYCRRSNRVEQRPEVNYEPVIHRQLDNQ